MKSFLFLLISSFGILSNASSFGCQNENLNQLIFKFLNYFQPNPPCPPSNRLLNLVKSGIQQESLKNKEQVEDPAEKKANLSNSFEINIDTVSMYQNYLGNLF